MLFVLTATLWAMIANFHEFLFDKTPNYLLAAVGGTLILLTLWLLVEAILAWRRFSRT